MVPSGIMFHSGNNVPLGSFALRIMVLRATCFCVSTRNGVLSPNLILSLSGIMLVGEVCLRFAEVLWCCWLTVVCLSPSRKLRRFCIGCRFGARSQIRGSI